jgi:hypothetical protein
MCACKTGCLARIVGRLAAIVTDQPPAIRRAVATYRDVRKSLQDRPRYGVRSTS